jgi:hypothetical protein
MRFYARDHIRTERIREKLEIEGVVEKIDKILHRVDSACGPNERLYVADKD